jgi:chemotaxis protein histidine kinase CheA
MALKKVKRPVIKNEEAVVEETVTTPVVEEEVTETPAVEVEVTEEVVETVEEPVEEVVKEEPKAKAETKKATTTKKASTTTTKKETAKKEEKKETAKKEEKKPAKKQAVKQASKKAVKEDNDEEKDRATKKSVIKDWQEALYELDDLEVSLETLTTQFNRLEEILAERTNKQNFKFMGGMFHVQKRNGQVFKSPKVDYFSYKASRTVKTFTQDTENVDKYRGQYDAETKIFKADGKWNYDTKEFEPVDIEIVVGEDE